MNSANVSPIGRSVKKWIAPLGHVLVLRKSMRALLLTFLGV